MKQFFLKLPIPSSKSVNYGYLGVPSDNIGGTRRGCLR